MAGSAIKVEFDDSKTQTFLGEMLDRMHNTTPAMRVIASIIRTSVARNFEVGGRPEPWAPLSPRTLKRKKGSKILVEKGFGGGLLGSINEQVTATTATVGTNKAYAAIQQFGGTIKHPAVERILHFRTFKRGERKGKTLFSNASKATHGMKVMGGAYDIEMPARPFLLIQDEDWVEMRAALGDFLIGGT